MNPLTSIVSSTLNILVSVGVKLAWATLILWSRVELMWVQDPRSFYKSS